MKKVISIEIESNVANDIDWVVDCIREDIKVQQRDRTRYCDAPIKIEITDVRTFS